MYQSSIFNDDDAPSVGIILVRKVHDVPSQSVEVLHLGQLMNLSVGLHCRPDVMHRRSLRITWQKVRRPKYLQTAGVDLPPGCQRPGQESDRKAVLSFAAAPDVVSCASKFPQLHLVGSGIPEASQRLGKVSVPRVIKIAELAQGFRNQIFRIP